MAPTNAPELLAQMQLDAYNAKDINAFCACYAFPIAIFNFPDPTPLILSKEKFFNQYSAFFNKEPKVYCKILSRTSVGKFAFDREYVTGFLDNSVKECVAIYEVDNNLIQKIWFAD